MRRPQMNTLDWTRKGMAGPGYPEPIFVEQEKPANTFGKAGILQEAGLTNPSGGRSTTHGKPPEDYASAIRAAAAKRASPAAVESASSARKLRITTGAVAAPHAKRRPPTPLLRQ